MATKIDLEDIPAARFLGFRMGLRENGAAEITMPVKPEYVQSEGLIQGGFLTALADTTGVYAIYPDLPATQTMTSIELKLNFLRPATDEAGDLRARAHVVKRGKTIAVCDVEVSQQDRLVAKGLFTYLIMDRVG